MFKSTTHLRLLLENFHLLIISLISNETLKQLQQDASFDIANELWKHLPYINKSIEVFQTHPAVFL